MSRANDLAYPVPSDVVTPNNTEQLGLTIREHFASQILSAIVANPSPGGKLDGLAEVEAAIAYADTLIEQLEKSK